jgi:arsenate reductase (thioredoxin)
MKPHVLFLCTGNSARSQMAEGLLRHLAGDRFDVCSAGTHPVGVNPGAVEAMHDLGVDISQHRSKPMHEFTGHPFDYVITVCDRAKDACPRWPHAATLIHWSFEDPAAAGGTEEARRIAFRTVRDQIRARIEEFIGRTAPAGLS